MSELLKYHGGNTRWFYRLIIISNPKRLSKFIDEIGDLNGVIGRLDGADAWIFENDGHYCERNKITDETALFKGMIQGSLGPPGQPSDLSKFVLEFPWDGSGVWLPPAPTALTPAPSTVEEKR